jgi:hypothetical protein
MDKSRIDSIIRKMNKSDILPETSLRRNSIYYKLVCYINNSIALFFSDSFDDVALFIMRATKEIENLTEKGNRNERYFIICEEYIKLMKIFLVSENLLNDSGLYYLNHYPGILNA